MERMPLKKVKIWMEGPKLKTPDFFKGGTGGARNPHPEKRAPNPSGPRGPNCRGSRGLYRGTRNKEKPPRYHNPRKGKTLSQARSGGPGGGKFRGNPPGQKKGGGGVKGGAPKNAEKGASRTPEL